LDIEYAVLAKYKGFKIDNVSIRPDINGGIYYDVDLEKEQSAAGISLKINEAGVIFEEEIDH